jgi:heat shock protein HslJ
MKFAALVLACLFGAVACADDAGSASPAGAVWQVTRLAGKAPLAAHPITFTIEPSGNISGDASCNRFGGPFRIEGDKIHPGALFSTRRACEPDVMEQESRFLTVLGGVRSWSIAGDELVLAGKDGEIRAKRQAAPAGE